MDKFEIRGSRVKGMTYMGNNLPVVQIEVFGEDSVGVSDLDPIGAFQYASRIIDQAHVSLFESALIHVLTERGVPSDDINDIIQAIDKRRAEVNAYLVGLRNDGTGPEEGQNPGIIVPGNG